MTLTNLLKRAKMLQLWGPESVSGSTSGNGPGSGAHSCLLTYRQIRYNGADLNFFSLH